MPPFALEQILRDGGDRDGVPLDLRRQILALARGL